MKLMQKPSWLKDEKYYVDLDEETRKFIEDSIREEFREKLDDIYDEDLEELDTYMRDGFIPYGCNHGGMVIRGFSTVHWIVGSGAFPAHKGAAEDIERQYNYFMECAVEETYEEFKSLLESKGVTKEQCNYNQLQDLVAKDQEIKPVLDFLETAEDSVFEEDSIMYEIRFMYGGCENGIHSAFVSAAVNTEGPYHRQSISWAPDVFCEGAKEIEIHWKTLSGLKRKLKQALKQTTKEIF